jgi:hypothetical protein
VDEPAAIDLDRVAQEIDAEVRALRRSGVIPADLERRLDELFARHAPPAVSDDFDAVLEQAERDAGFAYTAPTESRLPAGSLVKRLVARTIGWYVQWFVRQASGVASTIVRAVRLLARRVERLEAATGVGDERVRAAVAVAAAGPVHDHWAARLPELVAGAPGRVLVADAGAGDHLRALAAAGIDAYGVAADLAAADLLADGGFDVRHAPPLGHLRRLADGAVGAVVLVGCVDEAPLGDLLELAEQAARAVAPSGAVVVVSASPAGRVRALGAVRADLSPAQALHSETWEHLLRRAGCGDVRVHEAGDESPLLPVGTPAIDENFALIHAALFPPSSYAVVARRS